MSIREMAYHIIDNLTDEQLKGFVMMFGQSDSEIPNEELLEAFEEVEMMKKNPEEYVSYTNAEEMVRDILR